MRLRPILLALAMSTTAMPARVHVDRDGLFGTAGEEEWMAFLKDPAGNTVGLVERRTSDGGLGEE